jgi:dihydroorotase-like cyclic amidohydrolase
VKANDLLIKNVRIIDPASSIDKTGDIFISGGVIKQIGPHLVPSMPPA